MQLLIDSVPVPDPTDKWDVDISLPSEEEMRTAAAQGCRYYPRCPHRMDRCLEAQPPLFTMEKEKHEAACYLYEENEIAPIEPPVLVNRPITDVAVQAAGNRNRERIAAAILVVLAFVVGVLIAATREPETITETVVEEVVVVVTATTAPLEPTAAPTVAEAAAPVAAVIEEPDFRLSPDGAAAKGALALNESIVNEIEGDDDLHVYTYAATAGQEVTLRLVTGGAGLSGSGFYAPFATIYAPDGSLALGLDNRQRSSPRAADFRRDGRVSDRSRFLRGHRH